MEEQKHVIAVGNPFYGVTLLGPFDSADEAIDWAEAHCSDSWDVVPIVSPTRG